MSKRILSKLSNKSGSIASRKPNLGKRILQLNKEIANAKKQNLKVLKVLKRSLD